jgi:hypothetical protein
MMLAMLLGPNTVAGALGIPVMTIGVKRYTHERNRGFAFALFYTLMNAAALTQVRAASAWSVRACMLWSGWAC